MRPTVIRTWWLIPALLLAPGAVRAQAISIAGFGTAVSNSEVESVRQARGLGMGLGARVDLPRYRAELRYVHAALRADFSIQPDYNLDQLDLALTWFWRPYLAAQVGAARRFTSPEFSAQEVGLLRLGVLSETRLARVAGVWLKGAYVPVSRYSGGGRAGLGLEVGLGVEIGAAAARLQGFAAFEYQRLDREAAGEAPLQTSVGQVGARLRL